ncbi:hypothetical protein [Streptomyces sp. NBC_00503]|uniref:hypothetical protein n=1 Tax=Streptomyces sp. NBC_00503 TaxID=2903659 RepID=UPI002E817AB2|nr:hypothetical protein [Streptomyces sp. NBC_00503]WUD85746.1 hypothetical protein OG490_37220 [Streptomyces sp. NBC_00503]
MTKIRKIVHAFMVGAVAPALVVTAATSAHAAVYNIDWGPSALTWPVGKTLHKGDVLVFRYARGSRDVAIVDAINFARCIVPRGATVLSSGNDRVTLTQGTHYYISSFRGQCAGGTKMAVLAT